MLGGSATKIRNCRVGGSPHHPSMSVNEVRSPERVGRVLVWPCLAASTWLPAHVAARGGYQGCDLLGGPVGTKTMALCGCGCVNAALAATEEAVS